jgi:hypothetical protein
MNESEYHRYEIERAAEEAKVLQYLVDGQIVDNLEQAHELINKRAEDLLTPEILETIAGKATDIHRPGIGFSGVDHNKPWEENPELESVFTNGLLGNRKYLRKDDVDLRTAWAQNSRHPHPEFGRQPVFFNITGRVHRDTHKKEETNDYILSGHLRPGGVTILFDLSPFKEIGGTVDSAHETLELHGKHKGGHHKFIFDSPYLNPDSLHPDKDYDEQGRLKAAGEYGFTLYTRVAPRYFRGVVVRPSSEIKQRTNMFQGSIGLPEDAKWNKPRLEEYFSHSKNGFDSDNPLIRKLYAEQAALAMVKANQETPERIVPVYDINGNMLWPREIAYEDLKLHLANEPKEQQEETPSRTQDRENIH